jgi:hypothetical protein
MNAQPMDYGFWDGRSFRVKPIDRRPPKLHEVVVVGGGNPGLTSWGVTPGDVERPDACQRCRTTRRRIVARLVDEGVLQTFPLIVLRHAKALAREEWDAAGTPGNDKMWAPTYRNYGGKDFVEYGQRNTKKGGFLDQISDYMPMAVA